MQETTQPNIAFRFIPGSIDVTDNLVQYAADIYNDARVRHPVRRRLARPLRHVHG